MPLALDPGEAILWTSYRTMFISKGMDTVTMLVILSSSLVQSIGRWT